MLDAPGYSEKVRHVYSVAYPDRYVLRPSEVDRSKGLILKNLKEIGLSLSEVKKLNILNVDTGTEVMAFCGFGFNKLFHFDISNIACANVNRLKDRLELEGKVVSTCLDICIPNAMQTSEDVDFVYLNGVLQHLNNPGYALQNIFKNMSVGGKFFVRYYRHGNLVWFIADFVRRVISYGDREMFMRIYEQDYLPGLSDNIFLSIIYDDFFTPTLRVYHPDDIVSYFLKCGFSPLSNSKVGLCKHGQFMDQSTNGINQWFSKNSDDARYDDETISFPENVSQLEGVTFDSEWAEETLALMRKVIGQAGNKECSAVDRVAMAMKVHAAVCLPRVYRDDQLLVNAHNAGNYKDVERLIHSKLQKILSEFLDLG
jgi:SAM-dependent methyltransferase